MVDIGFELTQPLHDILGSNMFVHHCLAFLNTLGMYILMIYTVIGIGYWQGKPGLIVVEICIFIVRLICGWLTQLPYSTEYLASQHDFPDCLTNLFRSTVSDELSSRRQHANFFFFYSGHAALVSLLAVHFYRIGHLHYSFACHIFNFLQILRLLATRGHYTIDLITGIMVGWRAHKFVPSIDRYLQMTIDHYETNLKCDIKTFFSGKTIFITGATGFVGKCLIEKLLRSCPNVHQICILVRPKRGSSSNERVIELCSSPLFDIVRSTYPDFASKLYVIEGDLAQPNFGMSKSDQIKLIDECHIVFHCAATIRFDEPLKTALELNLLSVKKLIELCHKMECIESIVHVSTAYANCDRTHIDEIVYPTNVDPNVMLNLIKTIDESVLDLNTPFLLRGLPNTYTFTKGLAEVYLTQHAKHLPIAIIRPSMIGSTWIEPIPGFIDNYTGHTGLIAAVVTGALRVVHADKTVKPNIVPVDTVVNMMLTIAWYTAGTSQSNDKSLPVYHCCAAEESMNNKCITSYEWIATAIKQLHTNEIGFERCFRWPKLSFTRNKFIYKIRHFLEELCVAFIFDLILWSTRQKPRFVQQSKKLRKFVRVLYHFSNNTWTFSNKQRDILWKAIDNNDQDRKLFNFDLTELDWTDYIKDHVIGVKKYLLKEDINRMSTCYKRIS
ncbi:unnamed protein product, partial [Rotaria sp. Silwood1]